MLRSLLGDRAPWLVRWLPVVGVLVGLGMGALLWALTGSIFFLAREGTIAIGGVLGLVGGVVARTRVGRWLLEFTEAPLQHAPDLPAEFRHVDSRVEPRPPAGWPRY